MLCVRGLFVLIQSWCDGSGPPFGFLCHTFSRLFWLISRLCPHFCRGSLWHVAADVEYLPGVCPQLSLQSPGVRSHLILSFDFFSTWEYPISTSSNYCISLFRCGFASPELILRFAACFQWGIRRWLSHQFQRYLHSDAKFSRERGISAPVEKKKGGGGGGGEAVVVLLSIKSHWTAWPPPPPSSPSANRVRVRVMATVVIAMLTRKQKNSFVWPNHTAPSDCTQCQQDNKNYKVWFCTACYLFLLYIRPDLDGVQTAISV